MPFDIGAVGMNTANTAIGTIMGLAMEKHNDKRQYEMQQKLNKLQVDAQYGLTDYNYRKQLEMWEKTNFPAQVEQLRKAGLNPGLIYGMGGAGGATVGSGSGPSAPSGGHAPSGGGEIMGMMSQMALMDAQRKVLESQARKNNVEADKTAGVDTELGKTQIASLTQGIKNQEAVEQLTKIQTAIGEIQLGIDQETRDQKLRQIYAITQDLENNAAITAETFMEKMEIIRNEAIAGTLRNELTRAGIKKTEAEIEEITAKIEATWRSIDQKDTQLAIEKYRAEVGELGAIGGIANGAISTLFSLFKKGTKISKTNINITRPAN